LRPDVVSGLVLAAPAVAALSHVVVVSVAAVVVAGSVLTTVVCDVVVTSVLVSVSVDAGVGSVTDDAVIVAGAALPARLAAEVKLNDCNEEEFTDASVACTAVSRFVAFAHTIAIKHNPQTRRYR